MGASPSKTRTFFLASSRAPSRSPACACNAPQQTCSFVTSTSNPFARKTRPVARLTRAKSPSPTHPVNNNTPAFPCFDPKFVFGICARRTGRELSNNPSPKTTLRPNNPAIPLLINKRAKPRSRNTRAPPNINRNRHGDSQTCRNTNRNSLLVRSACGWARDNSSRLDSSNSPYSTPAGHACSHARHPRHRSICLRNVSDVFSNLPSATDRIR